MRFLFIAISIAVFSCCVSAQNRIKVADIPTALTEKCGEPLAEIGEPWDSTCIQKKGIPRTRLVEACFTDNSWQILCDRGGYSIGRFKVSVSRKSGDLKQSVIEERVPDEAKLVCGRNKTAADEDFATVKRGHLPKHSVLSPTLPALADGGTVFYQGDGYILEIRKRMARRNEVEGYWYGPILYFDLSDSFRRVRSGVDFISKEKLNSLKSSKEERKDLKSPSNYILNDDDLGIDSSITRKMATRDLTILGVIVGVSNFAEVQKLIGQTYLSHDGDAGASTYGLCYVGDDGTILAFESGEMGGTDHVVLSAKIFKSKKLYRFGENCVSSRKISKLIKFESGLGLALSRKQIISKNGKPQKSTENQMVYSFDFTEKKDKKNHYIGSFVQIQFESTAITGISVSEVTEVSDLN